MGHGADMLTMVAAAKALVEAGKSTRDIADALDISIAAARYHVRKYRAPKPPEVILSDADVASMLDDPSQTLAMLAASGVKFTGVPDSTALWLDDRFTHSEIAAALNVSAGSVKSRCKRVRDRHNVKPNNGAGKVIGGRRFLPVVRESKTEPNITLKMCDAEAAIRKQIDERRAEIDQIRCARIVHARRIEAAREELRKVEVELAAEREAFDHEFGSADNEKSDDAAKPAPPVETPIAVIPPTLEEIHAKGMKIRQLPDMDLMALASAHTAKEIAAAFGMNASYISKYVREVRNRNGVKRVVKQPRGNHPRFFHKLTRAEWDWLFDQALRNPPKNIIRIVDGQSQRVPKSFVFPELP